MLTALTLSLLVSHVSVTDFGAKPNSLDDATEAVAKAVAAAKGKGSVVDFPKGEYHFYREHGFERTLYLSNSDVANPRRISILIENREDLKLVGKGARLVFHDRVMPFAILGSKKISLQGFEVDWQRPLMSQGKVEAADATGITLKIDPSKYPYRLDGGKIVFTDKTWARQPWGFMEFDPETRGVAYGTGDWGCLGGGWENYQATEISPGLVRMAFAFKRLPKVGNILVARHGVRDHAGTFILDSKDIALTDMSYRHTSGLGVLAQYTENLTYKNVQIAPSVESGRMFAGHDDGFHYSNCKGKILVDGCRFEGLMDDPINVHGTSVRVDSKVSDRTLKVKFMHGQSVGLRFGDVGDTVSFIDHESLLSRGTAKIAAINRISPEEFDVTFDHAVPELGDGDALENLTWTPAFTVRKSVFGTVRARGLLVSTPGKVVIEDNVFRSSGSAILIAGDANGWYESGAVRDVTIRRNWFGNCLTSPYQFCEAVISIDPEIPKMGTEPFHRGIKIEGNTFEVFDAPLLWAKSAGDLTFKNNFVQRSSKYKPWHGNMEPLTFLGCSNVSVSGNQLDTRFTTRGVKIEGGKPETVKVEGFE